jgi:hypothetical protein
MGTCSVTKSAETVPAAEEQGICSQSKPSFSALLPASAQPI